MGIEATLVAGSDGIGLWQRWIVVENLFVWKKVPIDSDL